MDDGESPRTRSASTTNRRRRARCARSFEANVDEPIIERGNDARMSYGDRFEVKFVKEDGVWKLKDLD